MRSIIKNSFFIVLIAITVFINLKGFVEGQDWGDDFAGYVIQAQTVASGDYDTLRTNMGRNDFLLNYPWGFPVIIAPVIKYFETDYILIKKYTYLFFIIALLFTFVLFKHESTNAFFSLLIMAASPYFWEFKNNLNSDLPNLCFVMCSLFLIDRIVVRKGKIINTYLDACLLGISLFAAFSIRTQSFVLIITLVFMQIYCLRRELFKKSNLIHVLIPYAVFFICKTVLEILIPIKAVSYLNAYSDVSLLDTMWSNLFYYVNIWKELFAKVMFLEQIDGVMAGISICLFVIGISVNWKENLLFLLFFSGSIGLLLLTPFTQGLRYLIPVLPAFFYFFVKGTFYIGRLLYTHYGNQIAYLLLSCFTFISIGSINKLNANIKSNQVLEGPYTNEAVKMFKFLKQNTSDTDLIGYWKPRAMLLYSDRNGVIPKSMNECLSKKADYYVYYRHAYADQIPLDTLLMQSDHFMNIYENINFKVFKFMREPLSNSSPLKDIKPANAGELIRIINHEHFDKSIIFGPEKFIPLWSNNPVASKSFDLPKGNYLLSIYCIGTPAGGEEPLNKIFLNDSVLGTFRSHEEAGRQDFPFKINEESNLQIKLKLENDIELNGEDRNTLVYFINIYKTKEN